MNPDLEFIINEEKRLTDMLEDARAVSRAKIGEHRSELEKRKALECGRIASQYEAMTEAQLREINSAAEKELEALRIEQQRLLDDSELRRTITGRIVSVILENRA